MATKITLPPAGIKPTPEFWGEMSSIVLNLRPYLGEAVVLLAKETAGYPPLLALDFEILHGYLFPTLQSRTSRVSTTLASYVIDTYPHKFVLPPGTLIELISYTRSRFPLMERLQLLIDAIAERSSSEPESQAHLSEAIALVGRIAGADGVDRLRPDEPEAAVTAITGVLADINLGFARLRELYGTSRIVSLDEISPEWASYCEEDKDLHSMVFAQLSAVGDRWSSKRTIASNRNDARNVSTVLTLNAASRDGRAKPQCLQLLTETRPLLRLQLSDYGQDSVSAELLRKGTVLRGTVEARKNPWFVCRLGSAALYSAIRESYGNATDAFSVAKAQFAEWEQLNADLYYAHLLADNSPPSSAGTLQFTLEERMQQILSGPGKWYVRLRTVLQRESEEHTSRRLLNEEAGEASIEDMSVRPWYLGDRMAGKVDERLPHLFSRVQIDHVGEDPTQSFQAFGVSIRPRKRGQLFPCEETEATCIATNELIARVRYWPESSLFSIEWDAIADISVIIDIITRVFSQKNVEGEIVARYAYSVPSSIATDPSDGGSATADTKMFSGTFSAAEARGTAGGTESSLETIVATLPLVGAFPVGRLARSHSLSSIAGGLFEVPTSLVVRSTLCDLHFASPFGAGGGTPSLTYISPSSHVSRALIGQLAKVTHVWKWNPELVSFLCMLIPQSAEELQSNAVQS